MTRYGFPHPTLSVFLLLIWLLLMQSLAPLTVISGALLAWALPLITRAFWPEVPRVRSVLKLLRFFVMVLGDIVLANLVALRLILGPRRNIQPAWVDIELDITDPFAITLLTSTISLTPGTVSVEVGPGHRHVLVHALYAEDPRETARQIKERYEDPLKEIFE